MATYAPAVYISVENQTNYAFSFETIEQADVYVKVGENLTTDFTITNYTTSGGGTVVLTTAPEVGTEVTVFRDTDITSMDATFVSGSAIRAQDLNGDFTQLRNAIQETESNVDSIIQNPYELPVASDVTLGGIKVGDNLSITADGVLSSTDTSGVPEAPNDGKQYGRQSEAWTEITPPAPSGVTKIIAGTNVTISPTSGVGDVTINSTGGSGGGIPEAPQDGNTYGRKDAAWSEIVAPTGGITYKGTRDLTLAAPAGPSNGDFYINTATTGNCDPSWTGIAGTALNGGERVVFNGSQWDLLPAEGGMWSQNGNAIYYNDGSVGIGTTSPTANLHVANSVSPVINLERTGAGFDPASLRCDNGGRDFRFKTNQDYYFDEVDDTRMTIQAGGNVGIGTDSPGSKLSFGNYIPSNGQTINLFEDGNSKYGFGIQSLELRTYCNSDASITFGRVSSSDGETFIEDVRIDANGNVGIGTDSPAEKLHVAGVTLSKQFDSTLTPNTGDAAYRSRLLGGSTSFHMYCDMDGGGLIALRSNGIITAQGYDLDSLPALPA